MNKKIALFLFAFLFLFLVGCSGKEEPDVYINVEIDGHYTREVLVDGKKTTEYYLVIELANDEDFLIRVYPETGWFVDDFEKQFPIGTVISVNTKDKIYLEDGVLK